MGEARRGLSRVVRLETVPGAEWTDGRIRVTPIATSAVIGGFNLSRPSAVEVSFDGRTNRVRIIDVTRSAQAAILLAALLTVIGSCIWTRTRKERS